MQPLAESLQAVARALQSMREDSFTCTICCGVVTDPVLLSECGHVSCSRCTHHWMQVKRECPQCRRAVPTGSTPVKLPSLGRMLTRLSAVQSLLEDSAVRASVTSASADRDGEAARCAQLCADFSSAVAVAARADGEDGTLPTPFAVAMIAEGGVSLTPSVNAPAAPAAAAGVDATGIVPTVSTVLRAAAAPFTYTRPASAATAAASTSASGVSEDRAMPLAEWAARVQAVATRLTGVREGTVRVNMAQLAGAEEVRQRPAARFSDALRRLAGAEVHVSAHTSEVVLRLPLTATGPVAAPTPPPAASAAAAVKSAGAGSVGGAPRSSDVRSDVNVVPSMPLPVWGSSVLQAVRSLPGADAAAGAAGSVTASLATLGMHPLMRTRPMLGLAEAVRLLPGCTVVQQTATFRMPLLAAAAAAGAADQRPSVPAAAVRGPGPVVGSSSTATAGTKVAASLAAAAATTATAAAPASASAYPGPAFVRKVAAAPAAAASIGAASTGPGAVFGRPSSSSSAPAPTPVPAAAPGPAAKAPPVPAFHVDPSMPPFEWNVAVANAVARLTGVTSGTVGVTMAQLGAAHEVRRRPCVGFKDALLLIPGVSISGHKAVMTLGAPSS